MRAVKVLLLTLGLCAGWTLATALHAPEQRYSADGLYNLANAYARAGKHGLAVLNYERAALLAPGDADIDSNLAQVRAAAHLPPDPHGRFARIVLALPPSISAWAGVMGIALIGIGVLGARTLSRSRWLPASSILLGTALVVLTVCQAMVLWPQMHAAVVLVNETQARVSPAPMGDTAFVLAEGETVTLSAQREDFALIRARDGRSGWVARANLGAVIP